MVIVRLPGFTLPGFKITAGWLLDVELAGVKFKIPPIDITFWPKVVFWKSMIIFDSSWISGAVMDPIGAVQDVLLDEIPGLVWDHVETILNSLAEDFYERHSEEKE